MQIIVEVEDVWMGNGGVINELEFYNGDTKLTYTTTTADVYDDTEKGLPNYWNSSNCWDRTGLNDGATSYASTNGTFFLWENHTTTASYITGWARFLVNIDGDNVTKVKIWLGGSNSNDVNKRTIRYVRFYEVTGTYNKTQHLNNRSNTNLALIGSLETNGTLASSTMFEIIAAHYCSLIKSNDKYFTYQNGEFIEVEPSIENFNNNIGLSQLTIPTNKVILTMEGGEVLGDGKIYRKDIDINKYGEIEKVR